MATPGFEINYTDPDTGANYPNAWVVIKNILYGSPTITDIATNILCQFDIYIDVEAYESSKMPVIANLRAVSQMGDNVWNTYFNQSIMQQSNHDIATQAYLFLQTYINPSKLFNNNFIK